MKKLFWISKNYANVGGKIGGELKIDFSFYDSNLSHYTTLSRSFRVDFYSIKKLSN
jgi:hypothetical protein